MLSFDRVGVTDTSADAATFQSDGYRRLTAGERMQIAMDLSDAARATTLAGIRRRHPDYTDDEIGRAFLLLVYGWQRP